ncbi:Fanconi anemia core complex-associated protein 20 isoform X2 [Rhineura floridana]|uniref:Fanconi anemia core complex-associated protein 20 isoform X2 n=1 Tax=Rhineura floridana TaxID=261503 RepID=UPI002AC86D8E|nr:Fanconi anemia core complex-associated protein 20 isoform X2 [Rhineura floridana]
MAGAERVAAGGRGGKLSLKRKRQPELPAADDLLPPPPPPRRPHCCWFDEQGLSDAESTWMTLLRSVDPHLNRSSLEKEVNLPEFLTKSSQTASPQPNPETFNIGVKQFQWAPFPLYHANKLRSLKHSENGTVALTETDYDAGGQLSVIPSVLLEQSPLPANMNTAEEMGIRHSIKHSTEREGRDMNEMHPCSSQQKSSTAAENHPKKSEFQKLQKGTARQSEGKSEKGRLRNNDTLFNEATLTLPAQECPASFSISDEEKTENHREEILSLRQCPMCQIHITGTWSKLDLDSHLAKCLSESAEDVIW